MLFKLAGDKEERDAKLRQMADELRKLKNKLGRQEQLEDEVCGLLYTNMKKLKITFFGMQSVGIHDILVEEMKKSNQGIQEPSCIVVLYSGFSESFL